MMNAIQASILKKLYEGTATYEGPKNASGEYHGKGKLTYADGSYYDGEWVNGLKEGYGEEFYRGGTQYKG